MKRFSGLVVLVVAAGAFGASGRAMAAADGDLWEITSQMTMEGMPAGMGMPAQTRRACTAKEWTKPPVSQDDRGCQTSDFQSTPTKTSWKMTCQGMSGEGEINRTSPTSWTGTVKMSAPQGVMTMNLSGKRVGDCDAGEAKAEREAQVARVQGQIAAGQKMADDAKKQSCSTAAESLDLKLFNNQATLCTDPSYKQMFCDKAKSYDGFKTLCKRKPPDGENGLAPIAAFCALDTDAVRTDTCGQAMKRKDLDMIVSCCPVETKALAVEHCAGRTYTALAGTTWGEFCANYAREMLEGGSEAPPPGAKKKAGKSGR